MPLLAGVDFVRPQAGGGPRRGPQEVRNVGNVQCPRCEKVFNTFLDDERMRLGSFYDSEREESFDRLCEKCYRFVMDK